MKILNIILTLFVILPFALFIVLQLKKARLAHQLAIHRLKKRIGIPDSILAAAAAHKPTVLTNVYAYLKTFIIQAGIAKEQAARTITLGFILALAGLSLLLFSQALSPSFLLAAIIMPLALPAYILININRRRQIFLKQLPDAIEAMVRSLSAGSGIDQAIMMISRDFPDPIAGEFKQMSRQTQLGISFGEVLNGFRERLAVPEVHYLAMALIIQRETGGHLIKILDQLAALMRRRVAFSGKLKAVTAESRFTALFIGALPLSYIAYRLIFNRAGMNFFLHDPTGNLIFKTSLALIFTGMALLKYLMRISF